MTTPQPRSAQELAEDRTDMATSRTLMAADRTLMAWIRTSLSMLSFGFTIYKVLEGFQQAGRSMPKEHTPRNVGLFLTALGTLAMVMGTIEYWQTHQGPAPVPADRLRAAVDDHGAGHVGWRRVPVLQHHHRALLGPAMPASELVETGAAALLFAAIFLIGGRMHPLRAALDRRSIISFSAGISAAYVFVHLLPELHGVRTVVNRESSIELPNEGAGVYFVAMIGFLAFYGLEHLRKRLHAPSARKGQGAQEAVGEPGGEIELDFLVHIGGFGVYVWLASYLLLHSLEESPANTLFYAIALGVHFLTVEHSLHTEHGAAYERIGRFVLAGMAIAGWLSGLVFALPPAIIALLVAFVSGAVVMNSAIMELPTEKDGRFLPFLAGALIYGVILLPLG